MPRRVRVAAFVVLLVYLGVVAFYALRPLSVLWVAPANLEPLATIRAHLERGSGEAFRAIGSGLLRLAPLGVLLPLLERRLGGSRFASLFRTVSGGAMISMMLAWLQSLVPSRVADVDTVILDVCGIALAHLLCYGRLRALAVRSARTPGSSGGAEPPRPRARHPVLPRERPAGRTCRWHRAGRHAPAVSSPLPSSSPAADTTRR